MGVLDRDSPREVVSDMTRRIIPMGSIITILHSAELVYFGTLILAYGLACYTAGRASRDKAVTSLREKAARVTRRMVGRETQ